MAWGEVVVERRIAARVANPRDTEAALNWQLERVGSTAWQDWPLKFQRMAFGYAQDSGWHDPSDAVRWLDHHALLQEGAAPRGRWSGTRRQTGSGWLVHSVPVRWSARSSAARWKSPHSPISAPTGSGPRPTFRSASRPTPIIGRVAEPPDLYPIEQPIPDVVLDGDWELVRCSRGRVVTSPSVDKSLDRPVVLDSAQYSLPPDLAAIKPAVIALSQQTSTTTPFDGLNLALCDDPDLSGSPIHLRRVRYFDMMASNYLGGQVWLSREGGRVVADLTLI